MIQDRALKILFLAAKKAQPGIGGGRKKLAHSNGTVPESSYFQRSLIGVVPAPLVLLGDLYGEGATQRRTVLADDFPYASLLSVIFFKRPFQTALCSRSSAIPNA